MSALSVSCAGSPVFVGLSVDWSCDNSILASLCVPEADGVPDMMSCICFIRVFLFLRAWRNKHTRISIAVAANPNKMYRTIFSKLVLRSLGKIMGSVLFGLGGGGGITCVCSSTKTTSTSKLFFRVEMVALSTRGDFRPFGRLQISSDWREF